MRYLSTRARGAEGGDGVSLSEALLRGLAPDGGLYVPAALPRFRPEDFGDLRDLEAPETRAAFGERLLAPFFRGDPLEPHLGALCRAAFGFPQPLRRLGPSAGERNAGAGDTYLLELFHGPTAAFKDVGARFLAAALRRLGDAGGGAAAEARRTVLVATSGDTGGAIAAAFAGTAEAEAGGPAVEVGILFPRVGVSERQRRQLTAWGPESGVRAFAVRGTFDDCQRLVKAAFGDEPWRAARGLTSANSINIARLLPQIVYHAAAALTLWRRQAEEGAPRNAAGARLLVPTGNVGNACAALWAREMGLPIAEAVMVTNANRAVPDLLESGELVPRPSVPTLANAMDVGNPSNAERLLHLYPDLADLRAAARADAVSDGAIRRAILEVDRRHGTAICPHTAAAFDHRLRHPEGDAIVVATAHPAKFETLIEPLLGREIPLPPALAALLDRPEHCEELPADLPALQSAMDRPAPSGG